MKSINLGSDDNNLAEVISKWLSGEGSPPSWRALFWAVFRIDEDTADEIADYVEPIKGNYLHQVGDRVRQNCIMTLIYVITSQLVNKKIP